MKTLLAGGWTGELGWLICAFIPAIRHYSHKFDKIVIVCKKEHELLYKDFSDWFIYHDKKGLPDRWLLNGKKVKIPQAIKEAYPGATIVEPREKVCMDWKREYFKYGKKVESCKYDLVIHARACTKYSQRSWNWPKPRYRKVLEELKLEKVCCIGTEAHYIDGTEDKRGIPLSDLCDILASSKVLLSPSSGAAHLGSLCGCPHVIMTSDAWQKQIKGTNKDRYKRLWNPFDTPCKVLQDNNWQPPVEKVVKALGKFL
ncbi:MAG: hypothetical protein ACWGNI_00295 [Desulfobacterales bacterium]